MISVKSKSRSNRKVSAEAIRKGATQQLAQDEERRPRNEVQTTESSLPSHALSSCGEGSLVDRAVSPTQTKGLPLSRVSSEPNSAAKRQSQPQSPPACHSDSKKVARKKFEPFPKKLMFILEESEKNGETDIISFLPHGKTFAVHDVDRFVDQVMPRHFTTLKYTSFVRQLHFYGFRRVSEEDGSFSYFHQDFEKNKKVGRFYIRRKKVPKKKKASVSQAPQGKAPNEAEESGTNEGRALEENPSFTLQEPVHSQGPSNHENQRAADLRLLLAKVQRGRWRGAQQPRGLNGARSAELGLLLLKAQQEQELLRSIAEPSAQLGLGMFASPAPQQPIHAGSLILANPLAGLSSAGTAFKPDPAEDMLRRLQVATLEARQRHATVATLFQARRAINQQRLAAAASHNGGSMTYKHVASSSAKSTGSELEGPSPYSVPSSPSDFAC